MSADEDRIRQDVATLRLALEIMNRAEYEHIDRRCWRDGEEAHKYLIEFSERLEAELGSAGEAR